MNQEEYNQDIDEELFIFHYMLIKNDIESLKKKIIAFLVNLYLIACDGVILEDILQP